MIIRHNHNKLTIVYVAISRLSIYRAWYEDNLCNIAEGLFARMAPIAKQLSLKAIDFIRDKCTSGFDDVVFKVAAEGTNPTIFCDKINLNPQNDK